MPIEHSESGAGSEQLARELEREGLAALDRFIETFNGRDALRWAESLSYPHVRVSPRAESELSPSAEAYAEAFSYESAFAMGWDHSAWDSKEVLHVSADKIHAAGQWCRYDARGQRIVPNAVVYVVTRVGGRWGIQARFGVDSRPPEDPESVAKQATEQLERFALALGRGSADGVEGTAFFPFFTIRSGQVLRVESADELVDQTGGFGTLDVEQISALQVGELGVNLAVRLRGPAGRRAEAVCLVTRRPMPGEVSAHGSGDAELGVAAGSLILL